MMHFTQNTQTQFLASRNTYKPSHFSTEQCQSPFISYSTSYSAIVNADFFNFHILYESQDP